MARPQGLDKGLLVDDAASRDNDQVGSRLHEPDSAPVDEPPRLGGQRRRYHEPVGHGQEVVEPLQPPDLQDLWRPVDGTLVHGVDVHAEALGSSRHVHSDVAQRQDAHRAATELHHPPVVLARLPPVGPLILPELPGPMGEGQDHAEDVVGHGTGVRSAGVGQDDIAVDDVRHLHHLVDAGARAMEPPKARRRPEDLRRRNAEEHVGISDLGELLLLGRCLLEIDVREAGPQVLHELVG